MSASIYLGHSHRCRADAKVLEELLRSWGYVVINPFDGDEESLEMTAAWGQYSNNPEILRLLSRLIYAKDRRLIAKADALVILYLEESTGAANEIAIGKFTNKPVVVLTDFIHPFIEGQADLVLPIDGTSEKHTELREALRRIFRPRVAVILTEYDEPALDVEDVFQ